MTASDDRLRMHLHYLAQYAADNIKRYRILVTVWPSIVLPPTYSFTLPISYVKLRDLLLFYLRVH